MENHRPAKPPASPHRPSARDSSYRGELDRIFARCWLFLWHETLTHGHLHGRRLYMAQQGEGVRDGVGSGVEVAVGSGVWAGVAVGSGAGVAVGAGVGVGVGA